MPIWEDQQGTTLQSFNIGIGGVLLKNLTGDNLLVRNATDSTTGQITVSQLNNGGNGILIGTDAGANFLSFQRNAAQVTPFTFILPAVDGTAGQVLAKKSGSPANTSELEWISAGSTAQLLAFDQTTLAFGSAGTIAMFNLPAGVTLRTSHVIIDTPFNGTPSLSIGIAGQTSKYLPANRVDLTAAATSEFQFSANLAPSGSTEAIIATYAAGGATVGAARIFGSFVSPS